MKISSVALTVVMMSMSGAFAAEWTPYVGLGLVIDKAGTSAKRLGYDQTATPPYVKDGGGDMQFEVAIAAEVTAGVKYGNLRGELEFALRSASEDDYELYEGNAIMGLPVPGTVETSTSVKHNSYMANIFYDFSIANSNWTPYVGAGIGFGTYKQVAEIELDFDSHLMEDISITGLNNNKTVFEWQASVGAAYNFTENWAADIAYRFNSSTIDGEFVYAHELKLGARYSF